MILQRTQAEHFYQSMVVLNNIGATLRAVRHHIDGTGIAVNNSDEGKVRVRAFDVDGQTVESEVYDDQAAFSEAYEVRK